MNSKKFLNFNKTKIIILIVSFIIIFFINIPALVNPCSWVTCPDYLGPKIVSVYPNFYQTGMCGGIAGKCFPPSFSPSRLISDIVLWIIINLISFSIFKKS